MTKFCVAIVLVLVVTVSWRCTAHHSATVNLKACEILHVGDGGILNSSRGYIKDAAFKWIEIARHCLRYVTDVRGVAALNKWIDASVKFNVAMINSDEEESFKLFDQCNESFKEAAPYISKPELAEYFMKVYEEFGTLIKTRNLKDINEYMIAAYPQFKEKLGCKDGGIINLNF